jgi:hypothetical protein
MKARQNEMAKTLIVFLLDRSGSMRKILADTIGGFNTYLETLQAGDSGDIYFTLIQFDSVSVDKVRVNLPVRDIPKLTAESYQPRGWTPLIEAACRAIAGADEAVAGLGIKVIICIQTDGEENSSSHEYTREKLNALIKEKTAAGWQFNFMGASLDAYKQAAWLGISASCTMSYDSASGPATRAAFAGTASNAVNFAKGQSLDTAYSGEQRAASGDAYIHLHQSEPKPDVVEPTQTVDDYVIPRMPA